MISDTRLGEIRAALDAATERPWFAELNGIYNGFRSYMVVPTGDSPQDAADARLIANAPQWLDELLTEIEKLQAVVEAARDYVIAEERGWSDTPLVEIRFSALSKVLANVSGEEGG